MNTFVALLIVLLTAAAIVAILQNAERRAVARASRKFDSELDTLAEKLAALKADERGSMQLEQNAPPRYNKLIDAINVAFGGLFLGLVRKKGMHQKMIASIAHDFRGPLASIRGFSETLRERLQSTNNPDATDCLDVIDRNVAALDRIVESSLALTKLEAGTSRPSMKPFLATDLFSVLQERFENQARAKGIRYGCDVEDPEILLYGDYAMLERVLVNLVQNAIAHTSGDKRIEVRAQRLSSAIRLSVSDEGSGISAKDLPHIFDEFYRAEGDRSRLSGGAGLGLALAKKVLETHRSQIFVESTVGSGTRFWFDLPNREPL